MNSPLLEVFLGEVMTLHINLKEGGILYVHSSAVGILIDVDRQIFLAKFNGLDHQIERSEACRVVQLMIELNERTGY